MHRRARRATRTVIRSMPSFRWRNRVTIEFAAALPIQLNRRGMTSTPAFGVRRIRSRVESLRDLLNSRSNSETSLEKRFEGFERLDRGRVALGLSRVVVDFEKDGVGASGDAAAGEHGGKF